MRRLPLSLQQLHPLPRTPASGLLARETAVDTSSRSLGGYYIYVHPFVDLYLYITTTAKMKHGLWVQLAVWTFVCQVHGTWVDPDTPAYFRSTKPKFALDTREYELVRYLQLFVTKYGF